MSSNGSLAGQVVVITGASSGIGAATARAFAATGVRLALGARRVDRLEAQAPDLTAAGAAEVATFAVDVRDPAEVDTFVGQVVDRFGRVDVLVNNAGLARGTEHLDDTTPVAWDAWNEMLDTNVKGLLAVTRRVVPVMEAQGSGHVIMLTSIASHDVYEGGGVYTASKHAALAIAETLRLEVAEHGIRVTAISPGLVETEFSVVRYRGNQNAADNVYAGMTPLQGDDIAACIVFAASRPPHVNIDEMIIKPLDQASVHKVIRRPAGP